MSCQDCPLIEKGRVQMIWAAVCENVTILQQFTMKQDIYMCIHIMYHVCVFVLACAYMFKLILLVIYVTGYENRDHWDSNNGRNMKSINILQFFSFLVCWKIHIFEFILI